ncbi:MAG: N-acetyl-gamma-glutamyl-phosphate reductase [Clostridiales bacterium]|jgi:N-acetyl-gamma-glutamyl-phosphate reductase|nr:N-acetyl-gamma-glutamyl-phosphate reductase [Clostridiales bacterium]
MKKINAGIIGANGYTGLELMNILARHPLARVNTLVSVSNAGAHVCDMYPSLTTYRGRVFDALDTDAAAKANDVIFSCLPHSASAELCAEFVKRGVRVIDLSADFRYRDIDVYEKTYKVSHPAKEIAQTAVYGLPEIYRESIKTASVVGNPGCYTTCSILPVYPLIKERAVSADDIIIDAKSGTSGAGKKAETPGLFAEVNESFKAYAVAAHRHTSEIEEQLSIAHGDKVSLSFTPHLLPITRGILSTIYLKPSANIGRDDIHDIYSKYYGGEPFVVVEKNALPAINWVKHSNYIRIGFVLDKRVNRLIIISCLDNLIKGASGQAVQNMNIMFGIDETAGLTVQAEYL